MLLFAMWKLRDSILSDIMVLTPLRSLFALVFVSFVFVNVYNGSFFPKLFGY